MKPRDVVLGVLTALLWGFNFIVIKLGLASFPPLLFLALRFLVAALPAAFFVGRKDIPWRVILQVGLVLGVVKFSLLYLGVNVGMPAGLSSLAIQSQVPFTILLSSIVLHDSPSRMQKRGMAIALGGIVLLAFTRQGNVDPLGVALILAAAVAWAVTNIFLKRTSGVDPFRLMIWMSLVPPLPLLVLSYLFEDGQVNAVSHMGAAGLGAVLYTGLVATVLAFGIWGRLLRRYSANLIAPFGLLVPVFGMAFSALLLHERLSSDGIFAATLIFLGLLTVVLGPRLERKLAQAAIHPTRVRASSETSTSD
ncbi:EamA family transporter [Sorangium sp. So ce321]|uniref:EamA family transporter n=1 Tax=Sorangium sp. So ce321 TaxID=3133300 RepID=UPI003F61D10A